MAITQRRVDAPDFSTAPPSLEQEVVAISTTVTGPSQAEQLARRDPHPSLREGREAVGREGEAGGREGLAVREGEAEWDRTVGVAIHSGLTNGQIPLVWPSRVASSSLLTIELTHLLVLGVADHSALPHHNGPDCVGVHNYSAQAGP